MKPKAEEMHLELVISGLCAVLVAVLHSVIGERFVLKSFFAALPETGRRIPASTLRLFRWVWHLCSVAWIGLGVALVILGALAISNVPMAWVAAVVFILSGAMNFTATRSLHLGGLLLSVAAISAAVHLV